MLFDPLSPSFHLPASSHLIAPPIACSYQSSQLVYTTPATASPTDSVITATMPHTIPPSPFPSPTRPTDTLASSANTNTPLLSPREREELQALLTHKLHAIPSGHLPHLTVEDILYQTPSTRLRNVPQDIGLAFLLRWRGEIDRVLEGGEIAQQVRRDGDIVVDEGNKADEEQRGGGDLGMNLVRAIWFYRLDPARQFQRYHDGVRWNIALFSALLVQHTIARQHRDAGRDGDYQDSSRASARFENDGTHARPRSLAQSEPTVSLSPAAVRFITAFLAAVHEHHTPFSPSSPSSFDKREHFIRLHTSSSLDLFTVHAGWAKKALKRANQHLSLDWERELVRARQEMQGKQWERVESLVGGVVPGRADLRYRDDDGRGELVRGEHPGGQANELLDALRVPYQGSVSDGGGGRRGKRDGGDEEERTMVCDLRMAMSCLQTVRPRDMLPVLMRIFAP